jgi:hypothetical protein
MHSFSTQHRWLLLSWDPHSSGWEFYNNCIGKVSKMNHSIAGGRSQISDLKTNSTRGHSWRNRSITILLPWYQGQLVSSAENYKYFGFFVYGVLCYCLAFNLMEGECSPHMLPWDCLVGNYTYSVAYQVLSWAIRSMLLAWAIAKSMRHLYSCFAERYRIREQVVVEQCMCVCLSPV